MLTETDIQLILREQHVNALRFGDTAIAQGLLKPSTVNFFLQNLFPSQLNIPSQQEKVRDEANRITSDDITYWATMSSAKLTRP